MTTKYFNVKNGLTTGNLLFSEANVTLGNVSNLHISGGSNGQVLTTDGNGVLSFSPSSSNNAAPMPYYIPPGQSYIINENFQGLTGQTLEIDGELVINGTLIDLTGSAGENTQVTFNDSGKPNGSPSFTFNKTTTTLSANNITSNYFSGNGAGLTNLPGGTSIINGTSNVVVAASGNVTTSVNGTANVLVVTSTGADITGTANISGNASVANLNATGHLLPTAANTYDLGSEALPWRDLWVSGNSIRIGDSLITSNATSLVLENPDGGQVVVSGNSISSSTSIVNGNSNVNIPSANGNVNISAVGNANVLVVTGTGANISGTANITGNANVGNLGTAGALSVTGNANVGNIGAGIGVFTGNVSAGNLSTSGNLNVTGNALVTGNLTVDGNLVYVNVETLAVEDPIIQLQTGPNGAAPVANSGKDVGTGLNYYDTQSRVAFMGWDVSNAEFGMASQASITNEVVTFTTYGNLRVGNIIGNGQGLTGITGANVTGQVANASVAGTVYTAAQPNITSVGTLSSLNVSGNANVGNLDTAQVLASANITAPQLISNIATGTAPLVVTSTTAVANLRAATSNIANTVNDAAQPNITSVGTLTSLAVTGNVTAGNVYANAGTIGASLLTGTLTTSSQPNITSLGTLSSLNVSGNANTGNLGTAQVLASANITAPQLISNVATGTAPLVVTSTTVVANLRTATSNVANTVNDAAQPNITSVGTLTSLAVTSNVTAGNVYANSGTIGASLLNGTLTTASQPNITSVGTLSSLSVTGNILGGNLIGPLANGNSNVNIPTAAGNVNISSNGVANVLVVTSTGTNVAGTLNATGNANVGNLGTAQVLATANIIAPQLISNVATGTSPLVVTSTTKVANLNADTLDGYDTSVAVVANTVVVRNQDGNIAGNYFIGNGSQLTGIDASTIQNGSANVRTFLNSNVSISAAGNANIVVVTGTGVNVAGTLNATGNANVGNLGTAQVLASANITAPQLISNVATGTAPLVVTSTTRVANLDVAKSGIANTVNDAAQPNITSVGTLTTLSVSGNANVGNLGTSGLIVATGNVTGGNLVTGGVLSVTGNANVGNIGTAQVLASANVTAPQLISNIATGTAPLVVTSTTVVANLRSATSNVANTVNDAAQPNITSVGTLTSLAVTGNATAGNVYANTGTVGASLLTGTLTTAAQPNITSVGTLTSLTVTGNITGGNLLGPHANGNSNVNIPAANGNVNISAVGNANILVVTGTGVNVAGTLNATGNANVGNLGTAQVLATANITSPQLISNVATGTAPLVVTSTTAVANLRAATSNVANTVNDAAQPNITSVGTLTSLAVTGNVTAGNVYANSGTIGASLLTGTLTTASQPNITSVGTLTSLAVTGNVTSGNVYANSGTIGASLLTGTLTTASQPNITSVGSLTSLTVTGNVAAGNLTTTGVLSVTGTGTSSIAGNLDMTGNTIANLATPLADSDAATKAYVDSVAQGLNIHDACYAATTNTLATLTGGTITYNNGSSGVGANLTLSGSPTKGFLSANTFDGNTTAVATNRILVKNEANAVLNGIYTVTSNTVLTRATDYDTVPEVEAGDFTFVTDGDTYNDTGWVQTSTVAAIGTAGNNINFTQFSGAGTYNAGTGLTLTGTTFSINAAQPTITSVGTLTSLAVTGTTTSGNFATAGNITASFLVSNVATGTAPLTVSSTTRVSNLNVAYANVADNINVTTQSSGNAFLVFANALTGNVAETANAAFVANTSNGALYATTFIGALNGAATTAGTVTTAAQPNITSVGTLSSLAVTGNTTSGNFVGTLANGNSNVNIPSAASNVNISVNGTANVLVVTATGANVAGTLNATGNANVGNLGTTGLVVSGTSNLGAVGNVTITGGTNGYVLSTNGSGTLSWADPVTTASPAPMPIVINSGNTLTISANYQGLFAAPITIDGTLVVDGILIDVSGQGPPGSNSQVVFNDNGTPNANANLTFNKTTGTLNAAFFSGDGGFLSNLSVSSGTEIVNGTSNVKVYSSSNVTTSVAGVANVLTISSTGANITGDVTVSGYAINSINAAVSAAGTVQGNATALTKTINVVSTVASGAGVVLPTATAGMSISIVNTSANALLVYPATGAKINAGATNAALSIAANSLMIQFVATSATQWYTNGATFS